MTRRQREPAAVAEKLLNGTAHQATALASLLAAARAAGQPQEVAGLDAALAAFTASGPLAPIPHPTAAPATTRTVAGRSVFVRVGILAGGGVLIGGAAYAAVATTASHSPAHKHHVVDQTTAPAGGGQITGGIATIPLKTNSPATKPAAAKSSKTKPSNARPAPGGAPTSGVSDDRGHPKHPNHPKKSLSVDPNRHPNGPTGPTSP